MSFKAFFWSLLTCTALSQVCAQQFQLSSSSAIDESNRACPLNEVVVTCLGSNLIQNTLHWFINADSVATLPLSTDTPYPSMEVMSGVTVAIVNVQEQNGRVVSVNSTLTTTVSQQYPNRIGCGSLQRKTEITVRCNSSSNSFSLPPSDQTCVEGSDITFSCRPGAPLRTATITWTVNDSSSDVLPDFVAVTSGPASSQLLVRGCLPEWNRTLIQCVLTVSATQVIYSKASILSVEPAGRNISAEVRDFLKNYWEYAIVIYLIGAVSVLILCVLPCSICWCCYCKKKRRQHGYDVEHTLSVQSPQAEPDPPKSREIERVKQERDERQDAKRSTVRLPEEYMGARALPDLGGRLQKYWFSAKKEVIITRAPVPKNCKLTLDREDCSSHAKTLNKLLKHLQLQDQAFLLHHVQEIVVDRNQSDSAFVFVMQPRRMSLKDLIYKNKEDIDWGKKYTSGTALSADMISCYGSQILSGLEFLYQQGFAFHGHVKTGNVFVNGDKCQLGGHENTLLGYRSQLHREATDKNYFASIDVIMFGHVVYEMATGQELSHLIPNQLNEGEEVEAEAEDDYSYVQDGDCKDILEYIFTIQEGKLKRSIKNIKCHSFFSKTTPGESLDDVKSLLRLVSTYSDEPASGLKWRKGARKIKKAVKSTAKAIKERFDRRENFEETQTPMEEFTKDNDEEGLLGYRKLK